MVNVRRIISYSLALILSLTPALVSLAQAQSQRDITPPKVFHEPEDSPVPSNKPHVITSTIHDENGIKKVTLFYRYVGEIDFKEVEMAVANNSDMYITELAESLLQPPGLEYYIQAEDIAGNTLLRGFTFEPLVLSVFENEAISEAAEIPSNNDIKPSFSSKSILLIGLGALVLGGLAAASSGGEPSSNGGGGNGGGISDDDDNGVTVTISTPAP